MSSAYQQSTGTDTETGIEIRRMNDCITGSIVVVASAFAIYFSSLSLDRQEFTGAPDDDYYGRKVDHCVKLIMTGDTFTARGDAIRHSPNAIPFIISKLDHPDETVKRNLISFIGSIKRKGNTGSYGNALVDSMILGMKESQSPKVQ